MKSLLILAAIASTAYVGYSYSATDGKSCLVCPMTGEPVFTSADPEAGPCCAGETASLLTGIAAKTPSCCTDAASRNCSESDAEATLTSADGSESEGCCKNGCCKDQEAAVDVTDSQEKVAPEGEDVVAELTVAE